MNLDATSDVTKMVEAPITTTSFVHRASIILWPSFLMAGLLEMTVFAFVDPQSLHWLDGADVTLSPSAVYSTAFFVFWLVISLASALTLLLQVEPDRVPVNPCAG